MKINDWNYKAYFKYDFQPSKNGKHYWKVCDRLLVDRGHLVGQTYLFLLFICHFHQNQLVVSDPNHVLVALIPAFAAQKEQKKGHFLYKKTTTPIHSGILVIFFVTKQFEMSIWVHQFLVGSCPRIILHFWSGTLFDLFLLDISIEPLFY